MRLFPALLTLAAAVLPRPAGAQGDSAAVRAMMQRGAQLDRDGATKQARVVFQALIDSAATPAARAVAQRAMAISYAFDGDCANATKYEELVIAYWQSREQAEPQNAFFQEGEIANEGAGVPRCRRCGHRRALVPARLRPGREGAGPGDAPAQSLGLPARPRARPHRGAPGKPRGSAAPDRRGAQGAGRRYRDGGAAGAVLPLSGGLRGPVHERSDHGGGGAEEGRHAARQRARPVHDLPARHGARAPGPAGRVQDDVSAGVRSRDRAQPARSVRPAVGAQETRPARIPLTMTVPAADALRLLREGNRRFASGASSLQDALSHGRRAELADGQEPFAIILGCSDSRVPAEIVFDQGLGDLFVIRVAGNIVAPSQVGSVEFAAARFGTRLVVVLGHSQCGAILATLNVLQGRAKPGSRGLMSIVDRIRPSVEP